MRKGWGGVVVMGGTKYIPFKSTQSICQNNCSSSEVAFRLNADSLIDHRMVDIAFRSTRGERERGVGGGGGG